MRISEFFSAAMACLFFVATTTAGDGCANACSPACGVKCAPKTCRVVCEMKEVKKTVWVVECEEFCVPNPRCEKTCRDKKCCTPDCSVDRGCDGCGKSCLTPPRCGPVRCRKKLVKKEIICKVPVYKCVVTTCDNGCCEAGDAEPIKAEDAQKTIQPAPMPPMVYRTPSLSQY